MSSDDQAGGQGQAGDHAGCTPAQYGAVKKGGYCMLKGFPCKVTDYSTAKPGKHGSAKATIVGIDIFTGKKYEDGGPTGGNCYIPVVTKLQYVCSNVEEDGFTFLQLEGQDPRQDLKVDDPELKQKIQEAIEQSGQVLVTVIKACEKQKIIECRKK